MTQNQATSLHRGRMAAFYPPHRAAFDGLPAMTIMEWLSWRARPVSAL